MGMALGRVRIHRESLMSTPCSEGSSAMPQRDRRRRPPAASEETLLILTISAADGTTLPDM